MVRLCGYAPQVGQGHTQPEICLPHRPKSGTRPQTKRTSQTERKEGNREETQKGDGGREAFSRTQIQVLRYLFHGRHNPSPRIGECAGAFGGGHDNAPLRILQRVLPQRELADTFGNH